MDEPLVPTQWNIKDQFYKIIGVLRQSSAHNFKAACAKLLMKMFSKVW